MPNLRIASPEKNYYTTLLEHVERKKFNLNEDQTKQP